MTDREWDLYIHGKDLSTGGGVNKDELQVEVLRLQKVNRSLRKKLKELEGKPDLHFFLRECIDRQKKTNAVLKEIVANKDDLSESMVSEFVKALHRTYEIMGSGTEEKNRIGDGQI